MKPTLLVAALAHLTALVVGCRNDEDRVQSPAASGPVGTGSTASAPKRVPPSAVRGSGSIQELQRVLLDASPFEPVERDDHNEYVVSRAMQVTLRDFKDALLALVDEKLESMVRKPLTVDTLENTFAAERLVWATEKWTDGSIDGSLASAPKHKDRWMLTLCILLAPGSDCLAAVYERREGAIRRAMVFRNDGYGTIQGAVHALEWVVSPPDADDRFYLLEAHTFPWPASNWRTFSYAAYSSGSSPGPLRRLAEGSDSSFWVSGFELTARVDGFTVGYEVRDEDEAKFTKKTVHRWKKTKTGFERIPSRGSSNEKKSD